MDTQAGLLTRRRLRFPAGDGDAMPDVTSHQVQIAELAAQER
jgi:hypothetical protein